MDLEKRQTFIEDLRNFIGSESIRLQQICNSIGWSVDKLPKDAQFVTCPLDSGHTVQENNLNEHIFHCKWKKEGYSNEDHPFPDHFTEGGIPITLSQAEHAEVIQAASKLDPSIPAVSLASVPEVPQSSARLLSSFTPQQRLALYEHVVKKTSVNLVSRLQFTELDLAFETKRTKPEGPKTLYQVLTEERDAKRRRINYRKAKHVHTKYKSQAEVTREVIENQMDLYKEWLQNKNGEFEDSKKNKSCSSMDEEGFQQSSGTTSRDILSLNQGKKPYSKNVEREYRNRDKHRSSSRHRRDKISDLDYDNTRSKHSSRHSSHSDRLDRDYKSSHSDRLHRDYKSSHSDRLDKDYKSSHSDQLSKDYKSNHSDQLDKDYKSRHSDQYDKDCHKERDSYRREKKKEKHSSTKRHHSRSSGHHKDYKKSKYSDKY